MLGVNLGGVVHGIEVVRARDGRARRAGTRREHGVDRRPRRLPAPRALHRGEVRRRRPVRVPRARPPRSRTCRSASRSSAPAPRSARCARTAPRSARAARTAATCRSSRTCRARLPPTSRRRWSTRSATNRFWILTHPGLQRDDSRAVPRHRRDRRPRRPRMLLTVKLGLEPEERELRDEVRAFLAEHCPDPAELPHELDERIAYLRRWQARCYEAGYVGRAWPAEFGGGGRPTVEQIVVDQEMAAAGAPERVAIVGLDVLGPAILAFGTDEQRQPLRRADPLGGGDLEPGLLRAGGGLGPRLAAHRRPSRRTTATCSTGRRRGSRGGSSPAGAACSRAPIPDVREAQGHLAADRRHGVAGRRDAADGADHRARRVLRALPRRRARPEGEPARRGRARAGRSRCTSSRTSAGRRRCRGRSRCARGSTGSSPTPPTRSVDGAPVLADEGAQAALAERADPDRGAAPPRDAHDVAVPQRRQPSAPRAPA